MARSYSADHSGLVHHETIFDDWRSFTIGIYMALVGYAVMVGLPVISTAAVAADDLERRVVEELRAGTQRTVSPVFQ